MQELAIALVRGGADARQADNHGHRPIDLCLPHMASLVRAELDAIAKDRILIGHIDERLPEDAVRRIQAHSLGRQTP